MATKSFEELAELSLSPDRLMLTLSLPPGLSETVLTESAIATLMTGRGFPPNAARLALIRRALEWYRASPQDSHQFAVAEGGPPVHGTDGCLHLEPGMGLEAAPTDPESAPDDARAGVDFYSRSAFSVVHAGQKIATLVAPSQGREGEDLLGKSIPARDGHPHLIKTDDSVVLKDGGVFAAIPGLVEFTGTALRVVRNLDIHGCVDFSTGNVDFPGDVAVHDAVRDCFVVKAGGDLTVGGVVEAATLHAGRDTRLDRGMAGRDKGVVGAARDVHAKYITNATVTAGRDLQVEKELSHCTSTVGRRCIGPTCALIGGELICGGAGELAQIGTDGEVATSLVLGRLPELEGLAQGGAAMVPLLHARATRIGTQLADLRRNASRPASSQAERMTELEFEMAGCQARLGPLLASLSSLAAFLRGHTSAELVVHKCVHAGTSIWLGPYRAELKHDLRGPVRISLNEREEPEVLELGTQRRAPLSTVAAVRTEARFLDVGSLERAIREVRAAA